MIHMYTVNELEEISGVTRRTIGDYISKGLLAGPSHRGRGARYSQSDADVLQVIPRLRTLMKKEFPSLREVHDFLAQLSPYEMHSLARKNNEAAFELEVRTLRIHNSLASILPQVAPEDLTRALGELTPEQIRAVDTGRYQLGAVIDMAGLLGEQKRDDSSPVGNGDKRPNGAIQEATNGHTDSSWKVNWLDNDAFTNGNGFDAEQADMSVLDSVSKHIENIAKSADMELFQHESMDDSAVDAQAPEKVSSPTDRIAEIAERVERLERLLDEK